MAINRRARRLNVRWIGSVAKEWLKLKRGLIEARSLGLAAPFWAKGQGPVSKMEMADPRIS